MSHYIVELVIWSLAAYFIGCFIGWVGKNIFGPGYPPPPPLKEGSVRTPVNDQFVLREKIETPPATEPQPIVTTRMERPKGIAAARGGIPDDLRQISGIGPKNEKILHTLGFFHFDQIAEWGAGEVAWVDDHLKFNGRIGREKWVEQAKLLAAGDMDELHRQFGTGGKK